ncbi:unnamed protein product [Somion occarium]|uniref:Ribosomal protein L1 n=1 Tax=Somion occarium TaxID=3059160 RepID=A0ABP1E0D3_9APHY
MAVTELIDEHVSTKQCDLAVNALLKHAQKAQEKMQDSELLGGREQHVWLVVTVKKMQQEKKLKPRRIPIVHPLVDPRTSPICLITKDPQREYKNLLEENKIRFISRVVGISKLKGKFKPFEARRLLLKENGLFLADERVIPLLPGLLGKKFFDAKKQPIPVKLTAKDLKSELERAITSTYFHQNQGTCASVKIGTLEQEPEHVLANLKAALPHVIKAVKDGWDNIQSLHIKTSSSTSLPLWSCTLGDVEGGRWDGLTAPDDVVMSEDEESDGESEDEMDVEEEKPAKKTLAKAKASAEVKGKKRSADDEAVEDKPKKKVKADVVSVKEVKPAASAEAPSTTRKRKGTVSKPSESVEKSGAAAAVSSPAEVAGKKKRKQKATTEPSEASTSSVPPPSAPVVAASAPLTEPSAAPADGPAKKKRRKSQNAPSDTPPADAIASIEPAAVVSTPVAEVAAPEKKKRRKAKAHSEGAAGAAPAPTEPASEPATTAVPAIPTAVKQKKPRVSAVDFFDETQGTPAQPPTVAPPPNTPADGLTAAPTAAPNKKRRKSKAGVESTPLTTALNKIADEAVTKPVEDETPAKKQRRKKRASTTAKQADGEATIPAVISASLPSAVETPSEDVAAPASSDVKEKKKRKHKKAEADGATPPADTVSDTPTAQDVKQKRSASGAGKKKEKVAKGKRGGGETAKESLLGVKGLTA